MVETWTDLKSSSLRKNICKSCFRTSKVPFSFPIWYFSIVGYVISGFLAKLNLKKKEYAPLLRKCRCKAVCLSDQNSCHNKNFFQLKNSEAIYFFLFCDKNLIWKNGKYVEYGFLILFSKQTFKYLQVLKYLCTNKKKY